MFKLIFREPKHEAIELPLLFDALPLTDAIFRSMSRSELPLQQWMAAREEKPRDLSVQTRCQNINIQIDRGQCSFI